MTITPAQIKSASQALRSVLRFDYPADSVLSRYFRDLRELGARDRAFVAEAVYGVLRRKRTLERLCGPESSTRTWCWPGWPVSKAPPCASWVTACMAAIPISSPRVKGRARWARLSLAEQADLPDWLAERLLAFLSPELVTALAQSLNRPAPLDLRVNPLKIDARCPHRTPA
jgi:16S rRNA (cytosine967-C5)-methyltransferase